MTIGLRERLARSAPDKRRPRFGGNAAPKATADFVFQSANSADFGPFPHNISNELTFFSYSESSLFRGLNRLQRVFLLAALDGLRSQLPCAMAAHDPRRHSPPLCSRTVDRRGSWHNHSSTSFDLPNKSSKKPDTLIFLTQTGACCAYRQVWAVRVESPEGVGRLTLPSPEGAWRERSARAPARRSG
jgi:hypothetical protein